MKNKDSIDGVVQNDKTEPSKGIQYILGGTVIATAGLVTLTTYEYGWATAGVLILGEIGRHYFDKSSTED